MEWIPGENGLHFGEHGTVLSGTPLLFANADGACTIEVWVRSVKTWTSGSILTFYNPQAARAFSIEQDFDDLLLVSRSGRGADQRVQQQLRIENVFSKKQAFVTITSNGRQTLAYVDGKMAGSAPNFGLWSNDLASQMIIATSPLRDHGWSGDLKGLAIYAAALSSVEVQQHYRNWTTEGAPELNKNASAVAVYLLNGHGGRSVAGFLPSTPTLRIPERYVVVDQLRFEPPISEFYSQNTYLKNALINITGFVPLGFVCGLYFRKVRKSTHAALISILIGATVSLTIEYFQSYLPTRFSGVTDLITNTAGTLIGVLLCSLYVGFAFTKRRAGHPAVQPGKNTL